MSAADNSISSICKLDTLKYLNTLVLSRNPIHDIGQSFTRTTSIKKLSLSDCKLQAIGSALVSCVDLREARFAHNEITVLPAELSKNANLQTLDIGNNLIENVSDIKVLSALRNLKNLNLLGNPVAEKQKLATRVKSLIPNLRVLNAKPTERSELRKHSRKGSLHSAEVVDDTERERRKSKSEDESVRKTLDTAEHNKEDGCLGNITDVGHGKRKRMSSTTKEHERPDSGNKETVAALEKQTEKKSRSSSEKSRDIKTKESAKFNDIDDSEVPFEELIFSGKAIDAVERDKAREKMSDTKRFSGIVVEHIKGKKKSKNERPGLLAMQLLSSEHEFGLGGPSTWESLSQVE